MILTYVLLSSQPQVCLSYVFWLHLSEIWFLHTLVLCVHPWALLLRFFQSAEIDIKYEVKNF